MEKHLKMEILDPNKLIKVNNLQEITNPIFFIRDGVPTSDGLLSNEIFGISKDQRANIFAYIDLTEWFLDPLVYKMWSRMDKRITEIVHGTKKFIINSKGDFVEDEENGKNGIKFLKDNIDKIKIKRTDSSKRDVNIEFIEKNKDKIFINKYIVIPAYYRDVNSEAGRIGVGDINKLYDALLIAVRSLKETADFGISLSNASRGRIQEIILNIYNWFTSEPNIPKKYGIIRQAVMSKTVDYGSRLVLSSPQLKCERMEDMMVTLDHSAIPLASALSNFFPYILYWLRTFFENEFGGTGHYPYRDKKTKEIKYVKVRDPLIEFSDDRIKKEINRYIKGYSNRLIPIEIPNDEGLNLYMYFKGRNKKSEDIDDPDTTPLINRRLTWCDLFYMAADEVTKDKAILITRYPMDSYFNQFPTKVIISSTKETEPMYYDNKFYKFYPKIREEDIGSNTSNKFIDTMTLSNLYLKAIGGDYDGDQVTIKGIYSLEANKELEEFLNSKQMYIDLSGINCRVCGNEAIQTLYNFTLILPETKLSNPEF